MGRGRLSLIDEPLAENLASYDSARLRRTTLKLVKLGLQHTQLSDPRLDAALAFIESERWGNSPVREALRQLIQTLDEEAWNAQADAEIGSGNVAAYATAFIRARAANAVDFALETEPLEAALEAAYEVHACLGDLLLMEEIVRSA